MKSKEPLEGIDLKNSDNHLNELDINSFEYKVCKLIRYTGMHQICTYHPNSNIRIVKIGTEFYVKWSRPKKGAKKGEKGYWAEVRGVPLHGEIDFNIREFYEKFRDLKVRPDAKRRRVDRAVREVYNDIAHGTSPNTLRHTFAVELIRTHHIPTKDAAEMIGTTVKTLREYYEKLGMRQTSDQMRQTGWKNPRVDNPNLNGD